MNSTLKIIELKNIVEEITLISAPDKNLMWNNIIAIYNISPYELIKCLLTLSSSPESQYYIDDNIDIINNLSQSALMEVMLGIRHDKEYAFSQWELIKTDCINHLNSPADNYYSDYIKIILSQISNIGFPIDEHFTESAQRWQDFLSTHNPSDKNETVEEALNSLIEYIKEMEFKSEYEFFSILTDQINFFPPAGMSSLCREFFKIEYGIIREGTLLFLLHKNNDIRNAVLLALADADCIKNVSPIGLRRLISIRNWLSESQRSLLDDIIRDVRRCNTQCAALLPFEGIQLQRTVVTSSDGVGASSIFCSFTQTGESAVIGAIIKEGVGILDTWVKLNCDAQEYEEIVQQIDEQIPTQEVSTEYLQAVLPHFLSLNVQSEEALSPEVLLWMEWIGLDIYHPKPLSSTATLTEWQQETPARFTRQEIDHTFQRSAQWFVEGSMTQSWFEAGTAVEQTLQKFQSTDQDFDHELVNALLEPHRKKWQERFFFLALRAKNKTGGPSSHWSDFALIAKLLADNEPLIEIPAMAEIAINTLTFHNCEVYPHPEDGEQESIQSTSEHKEDLSIGRSAINTQLSSPTKTQAVPMNNWGLSLHDNEEKILISALPDLVKQDIPVNIDFLAGYLSAICASPTPFNEYNCFNGILKADLFDQCDNAVRNSFSKFFQLINLTIECHQPSISCELTLDYQESPYRPLPAWCQGFLYGVQYTGGVAEWSNYWPEDHQEMLSSAVSIIKDIAHYEAPRPTIVGNDMDLLFNCYAAIVHATSEGKLGFQG